MLLSPQTSTNSSIEVDSHMQQNAYAKINLYLHVTGKREDGYHLLDSLAVFAQACDYVSLRSTAMLNPLSLDIKGPFSSSLMRGSNDKSPNNLIFNTAHLLAEMWKDFSGEHLPLEGLEFILHKNLPVSSGIGGGSADAAAAFRLLIAYWKLGDRISSEFINKVAVRLGADVPVCMYQKATRMAGVGEKLLDAPTLPECGLVLVNPGKAVSTPEVFKARTGKFSAPALLPPSWATLEEMVGTLRQLSNDLQQAAEKIEPVISLVLRELADTPYQRFVRMSGSGATCFALYENENQAKQAAHILQKRYPEWWVWAGGLFNEVQK